MDLRWRDLGIRGCRSVEKVDRSGSVEEVEEEGV